MKIKSPVLLLLLSSVCIIILIIAALGGVVFLVEHSRNDSAKNITTFASCDEISDYIGNTSLNDLYYMYPEDSATTDSENSAGDSSDSYLNNEFSDTNIQVEGVDEADIVKTDGEKLFVLDGSSKTLNFIDSSDPANPKIMTTVDYYSTYDNHMYLQENKLVVISTSYDFTWNGDRDSTETTLIDIYDITNLSDSSKKETLSIEGRYINSRFIDGNLYLVSESYAYSAQFSEKNLPVYQIGQEEMQSMTSCDQVALLGKSMFSFTNITALNIDNIDSSINFENLLGSSSQLYMSSENLYLASSNFDNIIFSEEPAIAPDEPRSQNVDTEIIKLSLKDSQIEFEAKGIVPGTLLNQFSMDEYYGTFRVATTTNSFSGWNADSANNLYVLDENLNIEGKIENLAEGEQIYAARFLGDKAYMVTFRQVDPLFAIDLSDPANPTVKGELKIPGFSNYLQPLSENTILGIGKEAGDNGRVTGLKISLFDVSDITAPKVIDDYVYDVTSVTSDATEDHKAVLLDLSKNLLSIPVSSYDYLSNTDDYEFNGFIVFNLSEKSIEERGKVDFEGSSYYYYNPDSRSLYIGDYLYLIKSGTLKVVKLDDLKEVNELDISSYDSTDKPIPYDYGFGG